MIRIAASLAAAPFSQLASLVEELETSGVDMLHFDLEDGNFIPMITLGTRMIQELRGLTRLPFDVHIAMQNPEGWIPVVASLGVNMISVHWEACPYPRRVLKQIHNHDTLAGLAFNPKTPLPDLDYLLPDLDFINIQSTEPEYPHAPFLDRMLEKVRIGRQRFRAQNLVWEMDGGVDGENIEAVLASGADLLVVGRALFQEISIKAAMQKLREVIVAFEEVQSPL